MEQLNMMTVICLLHILLVNYLRSVFWWKVFVSRLPFVITNLSNSAMTQNTRASVSQKPKKKIKRRRILNTQSTTLLLHCCCFSSAEQQTQFNGARIYITFLRIYPFLIIGRLNFRCKALIWHLIWHVRIYSVVFYATEASHHRRNTVNTYGFFPPMIPYPICNLLPWNKIYAHIRRTITQYYIDNEICSMLLWHLFVHIKRLW